MKGRWRWLGPAPCGPAPDYIVAHSPNVRMAHKATELLCVRDTQDCLPSSADISFTDVAETEPVFQAKAMPALALQAEIGSSYTAQRAAGPSLVRWSVGARARNAHVACADHPSFFTPPKNALMEA